MRVVPRENEAVNETWISDRDRFSFQGLYSEDRLTRPMVKDNGQWKEVEWEDALAVAAQQLKDISTRSGDEIGALISPNATVEEMYLSQKLLRALGSEHIDYRLRQSDFRVSGNRVVPGLAIDIAQIEFLQTILLIGTNIRKEQPIIAHRIRKASLRGAQINVINPVDFDFHFSVQHKEIVAPPVMVEQLGAIAQAMSALCSTPMPASVRDLFAADVAQEQHHAIARQLHESPNAAVMLGAIATGHPDYSILCELASYITQNCGASFNLLPEGANAVGAWWSGAVPVAGQNEQAMSAAPMLRKHQEAYLLVDVEAELDCADAAEALKALSSARSVVVLTRYVTEQMRNYATVLLPTAGFAETSGTYVNAAGTWQSFAGATKPPGEARPGWKVLRVLGNQLALEGFDFNSSEDVLQAVQALDSRAWREVDWHAQETLDRLSVSGDLCRIGVAPIYAQDSLVRRAQALQETPDAQVVGAFMNSKVAAQYGLADGDQAKVTQAGAHAQLAVHIDERVADDSVWIPMGVEQCAGLGASFGRLELEKA